MYPKAIAMAQKAISLDQTLGEPHASLGLVLRTFSTSIFRVCAGIRGSHSPKPELCHGAPLVRRFGCFRLWPIRSRPTLKPNARSELDPALKSSNKPRCRHGILDYGRTQEAVCASPESGPKEIWDPQNYTTAPHGSWGQALEGVGDLRRAIRGVRESDSTLTTNPLRVGLHRRCKGEKQGTARNGSQDFLSRLPGSSKRTGTGNTDPEYAFGLIYLCAGPK
jgi:hypothetical protein